MKIIISFIFLYYSFFSILYGQSLKDSIYWNEELKLKISDFKGKPDSISYYKGSCSSVIIIEKYNDGSLYPNFEVEAIFLPNESFLVLTGDQDIDNSLLEHERLHFDITYLYVLKIKKSIKDLRTKRISELDRYLEQIYTLFEARDIKQKQYDKETLHGAISSEQNIWNKMIYSELDSLLYSEIPLQCPSND
ncbi:DUF922 domain-containing protein [Sediminitomix flava]|uniref:DUF922 domain-containing protein n=1 Tax=Sediminitomix flava TaxID=379075 RepID=A0A315ZT50_SEDFL|nr:DUF922 domain-containing protein [Sediminitomix flava]PWJ38010.1 hypothetical protein BC781_108145 [Sediminitomix flava]